MAVDTNISAVFENNRRWAERVERENPGYFRRLAAGQSPKLLWIGCSDSRLPVHDITGLAPGEVFVHRNVANIVAPGDLNCMAVVDFAVRVLAVRDIIVCGHYGCGGIEAASEEAGDCVTDSWLNGIRELRNGHRSEFAGLDARQAQARLCELHVCEQVRALSRTEVLRQAWQRGQPVAIHGWIYALEDGRLRDLEVTVSG